MPRDFLNKNFTIYRESLLSYSRKFNVSYESREELVNDTILIAIDSFDHDRGSFESYCRVILKNKIINFQRGNKDVFVLISLDDLEEILPAHNVSIETKENMESVVMFFDKLKSELKQEELELFNEIYNSCDNSNKVNITKASVNLGIEAATAWNIFRKIQRKADKLYEKMKENNIELMFTLEEPSYDLVPENMFEEVSVSEPHFPQFQKATSFIMKGLDHFISKLSKLQIDKINSIYAVIPSNEPPAEKPPGFFKKLFFRNTK